MMHEHRPETPLPCEEALDLLEVHLDGELTPDGEARLRSHLDGCGSCAAELALAHRIRTELRVLRPIEPAAVVPFRRPETGMRPLRILLAAAMLTLTVGGALYLEQIRVRPAAPSPEEIARATAEARFALAYVGKVSRHTGLDLRDGILHRRTPLAAETSEP